MFTTNVAMIDWVTITTWSPATAAMFEKAAGAICEGRRGKTLQDTRRMQYSGKTRAYEGGTIFTGWAEQRGRDHFMLQASGGIADDVFYRLYQPEQSILGAATVTRVDIQITVNHDRDIWSQRQLLADIQHAAPNRVTGLFESASGPQGTMLATVYLGSRTSNRVTRVYEKPGWADDVLLRYEVEYKGDRAKAAADALREARPRELMLSEVTSYPVKYVRDLLLPYLGDQARAAVVVKPEPDTVKWFRRQVLPALDRLVNEHDVDITDLVRDIRRILDQAD